MLFNGSHADFNYEVIDDVVVIYDLDKGHHSVTHDITSVLQLLRSTIANMRFKKVIYRDSMGIFDGVEIDMRGRFVGFYSLNARVLEQALNTLNQVTYQHSPA